MVLSCIPDGSTTLQQCVAPDDMSSISTTQTSTFVGEGVPRGVSGINSEGREIRGGLQRTGEEAFHTLETNNERTSATPTVGDGSAWEEVRTGGVYSIRLGQELAQGGIDTGGQEISSPVLHRWPATKPGAAGTSNMAETGRTATLDHDNSGRVENERHATHEQHRGDGVEVSPAYVGLLEKLRESIRSRVRTIPQPSSHAVNQEVRASVKCICPCPEKDTNTTAPDRAFVIKQQESGVGQRESAASEGKNLDHFSKNQFTDIPESLISDRAESASLEGNVSWNSDAHEESFKGDRVHQQAKPLAAGSVTETSGEHNDGELDAGDNIPARVGVLFSGGLDSVVVAAMLAEEGAGPAAVPRGEAIDLINVCFDR